jgi:hypothetical protein
MAAFILPLFFIRLAVGMLHPKILAIPRMPYSYLFTFSLSSDTIGALSSLDFIEDCSKERNSAPVICHIGLFNKSSTIYNFFIFLPWEDVRNNAHAIFLVQNYEKSHNGYFA